MKSDSLTIREWIALMTDQEPPLPAELLNSSLHSASRAELKLAAEWMRSIGVQG